MILTRWMVSFRSNACVHRSRERIGRSLHTVTKTELPALKSWLENFLPDSFMLYNTVRETLHGRWTASTFCTLGWPDILAAGEGEANPHSACYPYLSDPRTTNVFSPDPDHLEKLLLWPGYFDWSHPIDFRAVGQKMTPTFQRIARAKGGNTRIHHYILFEAKNAAMSSWRVSEDFRLGSLDPDLHTDYVVSNWPHSREKTHLYIRELLQNIPSVALFDKQNHECIGFVVGKEHGAIGMAHVRDAYRGRGLGTIMTKHLAQKYFCEDLPVIALTLRENKAAQRVFSSCGLKEIGFVDWIIYYTGNEEESKKKIGR